MRFLNTVSLAQAVMSSILLLSFVAGFLCVSFIHGIPTDAGMDMTHSGHASHSQGMHTCCDRGNTDHMELWKGTFIGIPLLFQDVLAFFGISGFIFFALSNFFQRLAFSTSVLVHRWRAYIREHPNVRMFNQLQLSFARGILHPKTH